MGWVGNVEQGEWGRWGGGGKVLGEDKKTGGCEGRQRFTQSSGWEKAAGVWGSSAGFAEREAVGREGGGLQVWDPPRR